MMKQIEKEIRKKLIEMKDIEYKNFQSKLIPTLDEKKIIGIRTAKLRNFANNLDENISYEFIKILPHKYFEEYNLHCYIIERIKNYENCIFYTNKILPYIDNWATCDTFSPKVFKKNLNSLLKEIKNWIKSDKPYIVRYGIGMLMKYFLDENFKVEYLDMVSKINFKSKYKYNKISILECEDKYYVEMMISWFFATALSKQYRYAIKYLENNSFCIFTNNMIIKKSRESYRISKTTKSKISKFYIRDI